MSLVLSTGVAKAVSLAFSTPIYAIVVGTYLLHVSKGHVDPVGFALVLSFFGVLPVAAVMVDTIRGKTDLYVSRVNERPKYFVLAAIAYLAGFVVMRVLGYPLLAGLSLAYVINTLALLLISLTGFKVSVHVAGIAGPNTYLILTAGPVNAVLFLLLPLVAWARLKLRAHTLPQVVVGTVVSSLVSAAAVGLMCLIPP